MKLEKMDDFFAKRIDGYENQMLNNVEDCKEGYIKVAELIPHNCEILLDLGCGTGLELKEIFKKYPDLSVTGIDLTHTMLEKLKENYPDKNLKVICDDYFEVDFGFNKFDCAISHITLAKNLFFIVFTYCLSDIILRNLPTNRQDNGI